MKTLLLDIFFSLTHAYSHSIDFLPSKELKKAELSAMTDLKMI